MYNQEVMDYLSKRNPGNLCTIRVKHWLNDDEFLEDTGDLVVDNDGRLAINLEVCNRRLRNNADVQPEERMV